MADVTSHDAQAKTHTHDKKTLRGPEMTEVTCSRPKMAKKTNAGRKCFTTFTLHPSEKVVTLGPKPKKMSTSVQNGFETNLNIPFDSS